MVFMCQTQKTSFVLALQLDQGFVGRQDRVTGHKASRKSLAFYYITHTTEWETLTLWDDQSQALKDLILSIGCICGLSEGVRVLSFLSSGLLHKSSTGLQIWWTDDSILVKNWQKCGYKPKIISAPTWLLGNSQMLSKNATSRTLLPLSEVWRRRWDRMGKLLFPRGLGRTNKAPCPLFSSVKKSRLPSNNHSLLGYW